MPSVHSLEGCHLQAFLTMQVQNKVVVATPKDGLKPGPKPTDLWTPVSLAHVGSASEKDVAIVKTLFEACGFPVSS